ncbi:MAG: ATP-dependent Lon protease [Paraglaciecola sp.]
MKQSMDNTGISRPDSETGKPRVEEEVLLPIPDDALILVPLRNTVLFPGVISTITIGRPPSVAGALEAASSGTRVGFLLQRDAQTNETNPADLHWVGTIGQITRMISSGEGVHHIVVQGQLRFRVLEFLQGWPFLVARVAAIEPVEPITGALNPKLEARLIQLKKQAIEIVQLLPNTPSELADVIESITSPGLLCDMVANLLDIKNQEKQEILECFDLQLRMDKVITLLSERVEVLHLTREIGEKTKREFDERQREHILREQMHQIQKELGENSEISAENEELKSVIETCGMPPETLKHAQKEFARLARMGESSAEASMVRTYLEWLSELPWKAEPAPGIDIVAARKVLDDDHYGLGKIKRRILEYLAVSKLNPEGRSPILCFVGPPGVGKTSLGQSIARATGRKFQRVALGGTHDEAEIRGHRRTYIGALPGNIIQAIRRAGSRTGVLMLDEIDKLGSGGAQGDPSSALLEVLDPEQNLKFHDNYLGVDFDLSQLMFIATANVLDTIPGPLRDRMEIIELPGYTEEEKIEIAQRYLLQRQLNANGLSSTEVEIKLEALRAIVQDYTREAGVRNLEREIGSVMRSVAMRFAEGHSEQVTITAADLQAILGSRKFESEVALRTVIPGVSTGLAWTPVGGDILFIEANKVPGSGKLTLTGQLGDVMKESAQAALTLAKTYLDDALDTIDIHVHIPAGATPKDGPSAGVGIYLALISLLLGKPVRPDVAMTGEISLRGMVLPVGGVKEKLLAALRAGITTVMLPKRNNKDIEDIPPEARARLTLVFIEQVEDAVAFAINDIKETNDFNI